MKEFLGEEVQLKEWQRAGQKSQGTLFHLVLYPILLPHLPATNEQSSLKINQYERFLSIIPIPRVTEEKSQVSPLSTLPTEFDDLFQMQLNAFFDPDVPNAMITDQITPELIKSLDEYFLVELFQRCLPPHDLFDLLD